MKNEAYVKCLEEALERLETGRDVFVCYAIQSSWAAPSVKEELRAEIVRRIWPYRTVSEWLHSQGFNAFDIGMGGYRQEYRILWVKSLIKEYSE